MTESKQPALMAQTLAIIGDTAAPDPAGIQRSKTPMRQRKPANPFPGVSPSPPDKRNHSVGKPSTSPRSSMPEPIPEQPKSPHPAGEEATKTPLPQAKGDNMEMARTPAFPNVVEPTAPSPRVERKTIPTRGCFVKKTLNDATPERGSEHKHRAKTHKDSKEESTESKRSPGARAKLNDSKGKNDKESDIEREKEKEKERGKEKEKEKEKEREREREKEKEKEKEREKEKEKEKEKSKSKKGQDNQRDRKEDESNESNEDEKATTPQGKEEDRKNKKKHTKGKKTGLRKTKKKDSDSEDEDSQQDRRSVEKDEKANEKTKDKDKDKELDSDKKPGGKRSSNTLKGAKIEKYEELVGHDKRKKKK